MNKAKDQIMYGKIIMTVASLPLAAHFVNLVDHSDSILGFGIMFGVGIALYVVGKNTELNTTEN